MNKLLYKILFTEEIKNGINKVEVVKGVKPAPSLMNVIEQLNKIQNACSKNAKALTEKSTESPKGLP